MPLRYYTERDLLAIEQAEDFHELAKVALGVLERKPCPAVMVCGPISTGGFGMAQNERVFERAIEELVDHELACDLEGRPDYCHDILNVLYTQIFLSGWVRGGLFLPGWESSTGATWERQFLQECGLLVEEYPRHLYQKVITTLL